MGAEKFSEIYITLHYITPIFSEVSGQKNIIGDVPRMDRTSFVLMLPQLGVAAVEG